MILHSAILRPILALHHSAWFCFEHRFEFNVISKKDRRITFQLPTYHTFLYFTKIIKEIHFDVK